MKRRHVLGRPSNRINDQDRRAHVHRTLLECPDGEQLAGCYEDETTDDGKSVIEVLTTQQSSSVIASGSLAAPCTSTVSCATPAKPHRHYEQQSTADNRRQGNLRRHSAMRLLVARHGQDQKSPRVEATPIHAAATFPTLNHEASRWGQWRDPPRYLAPATASPPG
jgi:hypothetical protein